jgi:hypothetical protein
MGHSWVMMTALLKVLQMEPGTVDCLGSTTERHWVQNWDALLVQLWVHWLEQ